MKNKSAKDIAFEKERMKLKKQIQEFESQLIIKNKNIKYLNDKIIELEDSINQKDELIEKLLEYTELSKEDLKAIIEKDKSIIKATESLEAFMNIVNKFYV